MRSSALLSLAPHRALTLPPAVRGSRPGKQVNLSEQEIRGLCMKAREIFISQPVRLSLVPNQPTATNGAAVKKPL